MSRHQSPVEQDWEIRKAEERLAQQKTLVRRRIVHGTASQVEEDQLRQLERELLRVKEQRLSARGSQIQRKLRDPRSR